MPPEQNKAILLRLYAELAKGNVGVIDEICSPDFIFRSPNFPGWPRGLEGARAIATVGRKIFAEARTTIDDVFAGEDKVVVRLSGTGTYIGEAKPGFPQPGECFSMTGVAIYHFVDEKIVDDWGIQCFSQPTDDPWG